VTGCVMRSTRVLNKTFAAFLRKKHV